MPPRKSKTWKVDLEKFLSEPVNASLTWCFVLAFCAVVLIVGFFKKG